MNKGTEILLDRMKLYPEELVMSNHKWSWVRSIVSAPSTTATARVDGPYISAEEVQLIRDAYVVIDTNEFTARVMAGVMEEPHDKLSLAPLKTEGGAYIPLPKLRLKP